MLISNIFCIARYISFRALNSEILMVISQRDNGHNCDVTKLYCMYCTGRKPPQWIQSSV